MTDIYYFNGGKWDGLQIHFDALNANDGVVPLVMVFTKTGCPLPYDHLPSISSSEEAYWLVGHRIRTDHVVYNYVHDRQSRSAGQTITFK